MSSYRPSTLFASSTRLPPATNAAGTAANAQTGTLLPTTTSILTGRRDTSPSFLSTNSNHIGNGNTTATYGNGISATTTQESLVSSNHPSVGLSYGLSAPHYVTLEEFGQLRRQIERERNYRDESMSKMKAELLELRERVRSSGGGGRTTSAYANTDDPALEEQQHHSNSAATISTSTSALLSSPPKTYSRFGRVTAGGGEDNNTNTTYNNSSSGGTLINRIEHLEAFKLALPSQLDSIEEKVKTIVEERMRQIAQTSQLASLLTEMHGLTKRIDGLETAYSDVSQQMLEHDAVTAKTVPSMQSRLDELERQNAILVKEVEQLHMARVTTDDARIRLENDVRYLRERIGQVEGSVTSSMEVAVAKLGSTREQLTEQIVERKLSVERDEVRDMVRRETHKLREEILEAHALMRREMEEARRHFSLRNSSISGGEASFSSPMTNASAAGATNNESSSTAAAVTSLPQMIQQHNQAEQQFEQKLRHIESHLATQLGDAARHLESKLLTRVREMSESARESITESLSERLDVQLDNVINTTKEDLHHSLSRHLDVAMRRESDRLKRMINNNNSGGNNDSFFTGGASPSSVGLGGGGHSRSNSGTANNNNINFAPSSASAGAPEIILDGVDLFVRELQLENAPLFSQCVELISDCRARGRTTPADAMLLMWKFLRGHLSNFAVVAENVAQLRVAVNNNNNNNNPASSTSSAPWQQQQQQQREERDIEDAGIVASLVSDVDAMVAQFGGGGAEDAVWGPCADYVEYCKARSAEDCCTVGNAVQLMWLFFRGFVASVGVLGARIDRIEKSL